MSTKALTRAARLLERKAQADQVKLTRLFGRKRAKSFMTIERGADRAANRNRRGDYAPSDREFVEL